MTDWREELIEKMALQISRAQFGDWVINPTEKTREQARAALAVAEPVIREECAKICDRRYMGDNNREDMEARRCAASIREGEGRDENQAQFSRRDQEANKKPH